MSLPITGTCAYCSITAELRPFGRGGALICVFCGSKPENLQETVLNILKDAGIAASPAAIERTMELIKNFRNRFD